MGSFFLYIYILKLLSCLICWWGLLLLLLLLFFILESSSANSLDRTKKKKKRERTIIPHWGVRINSSTYCGYFTD